MKTTFDNIEYIIKKLVEYQVKQWCSDVRWDGSTRLLQPHTLTIAKLMASDMGSMTGPAFSCPKKKITAHMRPYSNIKELNRLAGMKVEYYVAEDTYWDCPVRYVKDEKGEYIKKSIREYFDEGYADDTIILFLMLNNPDDIKFKSKDERSICLFKEDSADDAKKEEPEETDEERAARHTREERQKDDEYIAKGMLIGAVELKPSIFGTSYHYTDGTSEEYDWTDFRRSFGELIASGDSESGAYKDTVTDERRAWRMGCCDSVIELFQQYALKNLDDAYFMQKLVKDLPEFAVFKNADDCDKYEENEKKVNEFRKTLDWPTMIRL